MEEVFDITCARCPNIAGSDYCKHHKKPIWREDRMCRQGFLDRMTCGMDKASILYNQNHYDEKVDKILGSLNKFQILYLNMEVAGEFEQKPTKKN